MKLTYNTKLIKKAIKSAKLAEKKKYDNQEYYDRKMKHREEMIPYLAVCFGICLLIVMVAAIVNILGGW
jgi:mannitol/fructose-specific phosphotransferase system IIA component (Ntr-type)